MRNYNISIQKNTPQAYNKEYINRLENEANSLYTYLHYYNPEWRLLGDNSGYYIETDPSLINKASLESYYGPDLFFTVDDGDYIFISKIEIKRSDTDILTIYFKQDGNYTEYISDIAHLESVSWDNYVSFEANDFQSGSFSLNVPYEDANEIIIYTPTGEQIREHFIAWKAYYVLNRFNVRFSSINKKLYTINPNNTYPCSYDIPDDEQPAWFQQFSYTLQRPVLDTLLIEKLQYRWGYKNTSNHVFWYGPNYTSSLNIGATIYKKDAYDVNNDSESSDLDPSDLDHYIVFEASLAQYYIWVISTDIDSNHNPILKYTLQLSNELDFGLSYNIQTILCVPRYFYKNSNSSIYNIKYTTTPFDTMTLLDYTNYNVRYSTEQNDQQEWINWTPSSFSSNVYQYWRGGTELFPNTVYRVTANQYDDLIADTVLYEKPGKISMYQVRFEKTESQKQSIENKFEVIFS